MDMENTLTTARQFKNAYRRYCLLVPATAWSFKAFVKHACNTPQAEVYLQRKRNAKAGK